MSTPQFFLLSPRSEARAAHWSAASVHARSDLERGRCDVTGATPAGAMTSLAPPIKGRRGESLIILILISPYTATHSDSDS